MHEKRPVKLMQAVCRAFESGFPVYSDFVTSLASTCGQSCETSKHCQQMFLRFFDNHFHDKTANHDSRRCCVSGDWCLFSAVGADDFRLMPLPHDFVKSVMAQFCVRDALVLLMGANQFQSIIFSKSSNLHITSNQSPPA